MISPKGRKHSVTAGSQKPRPMRTTAPRKRYPGPVASADTAIRPSDLAARQGHAFAQCPLHTSLQVVVQEVGQQDEVDRMSCQNCPHTVVEAFNPLGVAGHILTREVPEAR